jgi:polyhydroxyalkanoate synthesis regulator phasin
VPAPVRWRIHPRLATSGFRGSNRKGQEMTNGKRAVEVFDLMQSALDTMMRNIFTIQDQGERMINALIEQGAVARKEGRQMVSEWLWTVRKCRDEYAGMIRNYIDKLGELMTDNPVSKKGKEE